MHHRRLALLLITALAAAAVPAARAATTGAASMRHGPMGASNLTPVFGVPGSFRLTTAHGTRTLRWPPESRATRAPDVLIQGLDNAWEQPGLVDTLVVPVGTLVRFHRVTGIHTITDGTGSEDPAAGLAFDYLLDDAHPDFDTTFTAPDTVNYFCWFHEPDMRGVLVVSANASVPEPVAPTTVSFVRPPSPNPTRGTMSFAVYFPTEARVEIDVWDLSGRHIASVARADVPSGERVFRWDGRTSRGDRAATGTYLVRVKANDARIARRFTLIR